MDIVPIWMTLHYFAHNGAERVIALEPYPRNYEISCPTIMLNRLEYKIDLHLAGCSGKGGESMVNEEDYGVSKSLTLRSVVGKKVMLVSLDSIVNTAKIKSAGVIKMDCEGCEYGTITESSDETLGHLSQIQIKCHYGYRCIKKRLQDAGLQ